MIKNTDRRTFGKLGGWGLFSPPAIIRSGWPAAPEIPEGLTILFQGESITDTHRRKDQCYANMATGLGVGYVQQIVSQLLGQFSEKKLSGYNRGISRNKVFS